MGRSRESEGAAIGGSTQLGSDRGCSMWTYIKFPDNVLGGTENTSGVEEG